MRSVSPWWNKDRHQDRRGYLLARNRIVTGLRRFFAEQDFVDVDPAILAVSPGNEAHLHGFRTDAISGSGESQTLYLQTSPEFACKKLLAAGESRIVSFAHVFRNRERGPLHHPEFTMVEWYRVREPYTVLMQDCAAILQLACAQAGTGHLSWRGGLCDPAMEPERLSVADAFLRHAGIDLLSTVGASGETQREALAEQMRARGYRISEDDTWADMVSAVMVSKVEPHLGFGRATILMDYPVAEAALARPTRHDPRVAERFELYACGVELANGFGELTDPVEQARRFEIEMDEKQRVYGERYPIDHDLLAALNDMPEASGIALGLDRLVMLATGADHIENVIWTPVPEGTP
ncbi:MAG: lysyl-tRNA synthetase protein [Pseudomonadota bacterium]